MSNGTIFFSYSRADQEFVLELAKKLRGIGADIWIDQLDIEAGRNWDKSVERALESSDSVLVVMSKTSVESVNVMDEVSIAIEEGKNVIPLLYEECKRPFRLKRRHYVDFTADKDKAFETLVATLKLNQNNKDGIVDIIDPKVKEVSEKIHDESVKELKEVSDKKKSDFKINKEQEAEKSRLNKIEAERIKKEQEAEKSRLNKVEAEQIKKEQEADKTRLNKVEAERIKKEQEAEKSRLKKNEDDRIKREEEIRLLARKEAEDRFKAREKKKSKSTLVVVLIVIVGLIGASAAWYFMGPQNNEELITEEVKTEEPAISAKTPAVILDKSIALNPDEIGYDSIKNSKVFSDFETHLMQIDSCKHLSTIDNNFWIMAQDSMDLYSYENYLENFPEGEKIELASQNLQKIQDELMAVKMDSLAWVSAKTKNNVTALLGYIVTDSLNGSYKSEAFQLVEKIGKKGWLYIGKSKSDTDMNDTNERVFEIVCCDKTEGAADKIPKKDDILMSKSQRRTYSDYSDSKVTSGSINRDRLAKVLEVKLLGNVVYVQILY
jgi:hypothetical protein